MWISSFYKIKAISVSKSKVKTLSCVAEKRRSCTKRPERKFTWRSLAGAQRTETWCPEKLNIAKMPLKIYNAIPKIHLREEGQKISEIGFWTSQWPEREKPSQVIQTRFCRHQMGPVSRIALSLSAYIHLPSVLYFYYSFLHRLHMKKV